MKKPLKFKGFMVIRNRNNVHEIKRFTNEDKGIYYNQNTYVVKRRNMIRFKGKNPYVSLWESFFEIINSLLCRKKRHYFLLYDDEKNIHNHNGKKYIHPLDEKELYQEYDEISPYLLKIFATQNLQTKALKSLYRQATIIPGWLKIAFIVIAILFVFIFLVLLGEIRLEA